MLNERTVQDFWNQVYQNTAYTSELDGEVQKSVEAAVAFFGDIRGKTLIDIGCGKGASSKYFYSLGASVIVIDISATAINYLLEFCRENNIASNFECFHGAVG